MKYPSPCDTCQKTCPGRGCEAWLIRYRYRQKQINAFAERLYKKRQARVEIFRYSHPDEVRRYIANGPCVGCKAEHVCDTPCPRYADWWDLRMEIARKKVGM